MGRQVILSIERTREAERRQPVVVAVRSLGAPHECHRIHGDVNRDVVGWRGTRICEKRPGGTCECNQVAGLPPPTELQDKFAAALAAGRHGRPQLLAVVAAMKVVGVASFSSSSGDLRLKTELQRRLRSFRSLVGYHTQLVSSKSDSSRVGSLAMLSTTSLVPSNLGFQRRRRLSG